MTFVQEIIVKCLFSDNVLIMEDFLTLAKKWNEDETPAKKNNLSEATQQFNLNRKNHNGNHFYLIEIFQKLKNTTKLMAQTR